MPALPLANATTGSPQAPAPDHNAKSSAGDNAVASSSSSRPAVQPAPSIVDTESHARAHVLPRRFLGPMPRRAATSVQAEEKRQVLRQLRRSAITKLLGEDELGVDDMPHPDVRRRARKVVHRFRVTTRSSLGDDTEMDYDVDDTTSGSSSSDEDEPPPPKVKKDKGKGKDKKDVEGNGKGKDKKAKKKGKKSKKNKKNKGPGDIWVGNSFDIGREFESVPGGGSSEPMQRSGHEDVTPPSTPASMLGRDVQESPDNLKYSPDGMEAEAETEESDTPKAGPSNLPVITTDTKETGTPRAGSPSRPDIFTDETARTTKAGLSTPDFFSRPRSTRTASTGGETFATARGSDSEDSTFDAHVPYPVPPPPLSDGVANSSSSSPRAGASSEGDSRARLIHSSDEEADLGEPRTPTSSKPRRSISSASASVAGLGRGAKQAFNQRLKSAMRVPVEGKYSDMDRPARLKTVQFQKRDSVITRPTGARTPVHPHEVLARTGSEVEGTSAHAAEPAIVIDEPDILPGGVVMRDRAAVKVGRHRDEGLPSFDENAQRRNPCHRFDPMQEYILGMTVTSIDFYLDWRWWIEERVKGHKRLRFSVPLNPTTTSISVWNKTDLTLALICPWATIVRNTARHLDKGLRKQTSYWDRARHSRVADGLHMNRHGTAIFLITFGERSRALDWYWYISGQLGLRLPQAIDIQVPTLQFTYRIAIPEEPSSATFNVAAIRRAVWKALLSNTEQKRLLRELGIVPKLELAWKQKEPTLDWVCWDSTVTDRPREWALLASFAFGLSGKGATLQVRDATHHGHSVRLEDGTQLSEPPAVEGYVVRHKSDVSPKEEVYICVADGHAFILSGSAATPPLVPRRKGSSPAELFPELHRKFIDGEHRRIATLVERCAGCIDLSRLVSVKLVKPTDLTDGIDEPPIDPSSTNFTSQTDRSPPEATVRERANSVAVSKDPSTLTSLSIPSDDFCLQRANTTNILTTPLPRQKSTSLEPLKKEGKKAQREFEVTLRDGHKVVFEAHTPAIAAEWVARLTELVRYWSTRRRVDARSAMDVVQLHMGREAFVGQALGLDSERLLNQLWNWCVIDGCRPVTFSGRVYVRRSKWGKFRSLYLVILHGSLVAFSSDGRVGMQPRRAVWPLFGSFVYSGMLASDELDSNPNERAWDPTHRVYQDGLQSSDGVEDTTFCVRLVWPTGPFAAPQPWDVEANRRDASHNASGKEGSRPKFTPPPLRREPQRLLICRARSKLERDRWVWALNCEKERFARSHVRDEETLRNSGTLPRHSTLTHTNASVNI